MKIIKTKQLQKGFTLIEVLLVIVLIGILISIGLVTFNAEARFIDTRNDTRKTHIQTLESAITQYKLQEGDYPTGLSRNYQEICDPEATDCIGFFDLKQFLVPNYLQAIPQDPKDTDNTGGAGYEVAIDTTTNTVSVRLKELLREGGVIIAVNDPLPAEPTTVSNTPLAATVPVTPPPLLHLDAGDTASYPGTGTTWFDLSGNGNNGTLINGVGFNSANGGSLVFDGVNDYVNIPYLLLSGSQDFTINIWLKSNNHIGGTIFGNYPAGNLQLFHGTNYIGMYLNNYSTYLSTPGSEFTTNPVFFTAQRISGNETRVYLNTVLKKTGASTSTIGSVSNFRIGTNTIGNEVYNGNISQVSIYNRALTFEEIQQNFWATKDRFGL